MQFEKSLNVHTYPHRFGPNWLFFEFTEMKRSQRVCGRRRGLERLKIKNSELMGIFLQFFQIRIRLCLVISWMIRSRSHSWTVWSYISELFANDLIKKELFDISQTIRWNVSRSWIISWDLTHSQTIRFDEWITLKKFDQTWNHPETTESFYRKSHFQSPPPPLRKGVIGILREYQKKIHENMNIVFNETIPLKCTATASLIFSVGQLIRGEK